MIINFDKVISKLQRLQNFISQSLSTKKGTESRVGASILVRKNILVRGRRGGDGGARGGVECLSATCVNLYRNIDNSLIEYILKLICLGVQMYRFS